MVRVFNLNIMKDTNYKCLKNFNATYNPEERIASALYEGYYKLKGNGTVSIAAYYADGYAYYYVFDGKFRPGVTHYKEVKDLNHEKIGQLFEDYKNKKRKPLKIEDAYTFLAAERKPNLKKIVLNTDFKFDYKVFDSFINDIKQNSIKYNKKVRDICKVMYRENSGLYQTEFTMNMIYYPENYKPKGVKIERVNFNTWNIEAELDNQIVTYKAQYDSHSINKYGAVDDIELAGAIVKNYVYTILMDDYKKFTENNIDYKVDMVTSYLSKYISELRGNDYRVNYSKGYKMKEPGEFAVDMTQFIRYIKVRDDRFNKKVIYQVIKALKEDKELYKRYYDNRNTVMDVFYPWFEQRLAKNKKLFTNVPKD